MTAKKKTSKNGPSKNDGKGKQDLATRSQKLTAKYTIWRSKEDVKKLEKVRKFLESEYSYKSYKADSKIYKGLPDLFLNAVKKNTQLVLQVEQLTAKLDQLEDLRACFCRIFELCEIKDV